MVRNLITITPDNDLNDCMQLMNSKTIRHLPVVEEGRLIGFVSIGDLVKYRIDKIEADAEAMRNYIQTA